jgi:hypothetical protein
MKTRLFILLFVIAGITNAQVNTWVQKSNFGGGSRSLAAEFSIGSKGYVLTGGSNSAVMADLWEYDTLTNAWTQKAPFPGNARESAVSFAIGTKGYIGTGMDWNGHAFNDFWEYNSLTDTWTQKTDFGGVPRYGAVGFSIGGKGYIGTGHDTLSLSLYDLWEYDTLANTWTPRASVPGFERYGAVGFSIGNKGYIGGGNTTSGVANDFWEYDPTANSWVQKADIIVPNPAYASGFVIGSHGFINTYSGSNFGEYDPATDKWIMLADLTFPRDKAVGFSIGGKGYICTGQDGIGRRQDVWRYTPCSYFPSATITASGPTTFCSGDTVILTASSGLSYMWWNSETTQSISVTTSGIYAVQVTDICGVAESDTIGVNVLPSPAVPVITQFDSLLTSSAPAYNQWYYNGSIMAGETGQSCVATLTGEYSVVVTNPNGCSNTFSYTYIGNPNFISVPICMVSVDSSSQYNIIVWDKTLVNAGDTVIVLREISSNNYQPIAKMPYDSLSQFTDTVRNLYFPNTGDPNTGTYRYKLQCSDTYGNYSQKSPYHNTIFFVNNSGIFTWLQPYEIENGANPVTSYILMRDDLSNGIWHDIGSVAGTQNFITDPQYATYQLTASWKVRTSWAINCTPTFKNTEVYNTSFSNIYKYSGSSINEYTVSGNLIISPNPFSSETIITAGEKLKNASLVLYNSVGQQVRQIKNISGYTITLHRDNLTGGIYFIRLTEDNKNIATEKLIVTD